MRQGLQRRAPMCAALAVAAAFLAPGAARADISVTYSTADSSASATSGGETITVNFKGVSSQTVSAPATGISLGYFTWSTSGNPPFYGNYSTNFQFTVNETSPTDSSRNFTGTVDGTIFFWSTGAPELQLSNSLSIGTETYTLDTNPITLNSHGKTYLYADLTSTYDPPISAPEPSTVPIVLLGALAGAGAWYRRRRSA